MEIILTWRRILLSTVLTSNIYATETNVTYNDEYVAYGVGLIAEELCSYTNTYDSISSNMSVTMDGDSLVDWYNTEDYTNNNTVSYAQPQITVFTHGLGDNAANWSNNGDERFAYDEQSAIEQLDQYITATTGQGANKYWVSFSSLSTFKLVPMMDETVVNEVYVKNIVTIDKLSDSSKHIILVFEFEGSGNSNEYVYSQMNLAMAKIMYDVQYLNGDILPRGNLVGHSRGGLTNMQYALDHPDLVDSIYSFGTPYLGTHSGKTGLGAMFAPGFGLDNIINPDLYYYYCNRWNTDYGRLYKDIDVVAMGGYSDMDFVLDSLVGKEVNEISITQEQIDAVKFYLNYGVPIANVLAAASLAFVDMCPEFSFVHIFFKLCIMAGNPISVTTIPEPYLAMCQALLD